MKFGQSGSQLRREERGHSHTVTYWRIHTCPTVEIYECRSCTPEYLCTTWFNCAEAHLITAGLLLTNMQLQYTEIVSLASEPPNQIKVIPFQPGCLHFADQRNLPSTQEAQMDSCSSPSVLSLLSSIQRFKEALLNRKQHKEEHEGTCWTYF